MHRLLFPFALALAALLPTEAQARRMAMDPQNRVHVGLSYADTSFGLTGGLDSRLTQLVFMDVGGFLSPFELSDPGVAEGSAASDYIFLRHALYVAPGVRIPHRQPAGLTWDLLGRAGFAAVWSNDVFEGNLLSPGQTWEIETNPAGLAGAELVVRKDAYGLRAGGKGFVYKPYSVYSGDDVLIIRPVVTVEAIYQW